MTNQRKHKHSIETHLATSIATLELREPPYNAVLTSEGASRSATDSLVMWLRSDAEMKPSRSKRRRIKPNEGQ
jgi:hypothetical protein